MNENIVEPGYLIRAPPGITHQLIKEPAGFPAEGPSSPISVAEIPGVGYGFSQDHYGKQDFPGSQWNASTILPYFSCE